MLHAVLFGLEKVLMTRYNANYKILIPYILEELDTLLQEIQIIDKDKSLDENLEEVKKFLSNKYVLEGVSFEKIGQNKYKFSIEECKSATAGVHDLLKMEKGSCPWPVIVAAFVSRYLGEDKSVEIGDSEFTEKGSTTILEIK
jgi:hypothetical protein